MIRISLGNVGSGKTVNEVREMFLNPAKLKTFSNIKTKLDHQIDIDATMICNKTLIDVKKKRSGAEEAIYELSVNMDFWKSIKEPINVVIDEAHSILNARKAMSKVNVLVTDWIALIRRVLGEDSRGAGELVLITQLPNRIDVICREMATQVRYHVCHFKKTCRKCGVTWSENSEMPEQMKTCPACGYHELTRHSFCIEIKHYPSMKAYNAHLAFGMSTHYKHYFVKDIDQYFPLYDTLQWENMLSDLYY